MDKDEIKKANRKALPKFILIVIISAVVSGAVGYSSARYGLYNLSDDIKNIAGVFGMNIAPWLLLAVAIITPATSLPLYNKAKRLLAGWDGEDEAMADAVDDKLSTIVCLTNIALIISYFLISASYSGGFSVLDEGENILPFCVAIIAFLGVMTETIILQQKCVDSSKKINPEKTASVYDMKFQKKWLASCDEAEKIMVGKCAYKAYAETNTTCAIIAPALAVCALIFGTGFLASFVVCVIWIVSTSVYLKELRKYSKAGNKIS